MIIPRYPKYLYRNTTKMHGLFSMKRSFFRLSSLWGWRGWERWSPCRWQLMEWSLSWVVLVTLDWLEIIGLVEMENLCHPFLVLINRKFRNYFRRMFCYFFLCFKSFVVHGILIESIYYITDCHDDDMSFPIQICDLWMDWMDGMDGWMDGVAAPRI